MKRFQIGLSTCLLTHQFGVTFGGQDLEQFDADAIWVDHHGNVAVSLRQSGSECNFCALFLKVGKCAVNVFHLNTKMFVPRHPQVRFEVLVRPGFLEQFELRPIVSQRDVDATHSRIRPVHFLHTTAAKHCGVPGNGSFHVRDSQSHVLKALDDSQGVAHFPEASRNVQG